MAIQVNPGPCPPAGCPPPTEIACISVDKVYDSCFQVEDQIRSATVTTGPGGEWPTGAFFPGQVVPCALTALAKINATVISRVPAGGGLETITLLVTVPVTLTNPNNPAETANRVFDFTTTVTLSCPIGTILDTTASTIVFCSSAITVVNAGSVETAIVFQVNLVVECISTVQLLVPSYGLSIPTPCTIFPGVTLPAFP